MIGLGAAEAMPWKVVSPTTKAIQDAFNSWATSAQLPAITADGKLGPTTCAALKYAEKKGAGFTPPSTCASFGVYPPSAGGGGGASYTTSTATTTAAMPQIYKPPMSSTTRALLWGAGLGGVALLGYLYAKKKGWVKR